MHGNLSGWARGVATPDVKEITCPACLASRPLGPLKAFLPHDVDRPMLASQPLEARTLCAEDSV